MAVSPSLRFDWISEVIRKTGAGSRCTSSYMISPQFFERNRSKVQEALVLLLPVREDVVCGHRDGLYLFFLSGKFTDHLGGDVGLVQQLLPPLADGHRVRYQDERLGLKQGHRADSHHGLSRAAREHDHAAAAIRTSAAIVGVNGALLVVADDERIARQRDGAEIENERIAFLVPGRVLHGESHLYQRLLYMPAQIGVDLDGVLVDRGGYERLDLPVAHDLVEQQGVRGNQKHPVVFADKPYEPVPAHLFGDRGKDDLGDVVPGIVFKGADDRFRVQAGRGRVPQGKRGDPVRMDVLRAFLEFGEWRDGVARVLEFGIVHLEQDRIVALNYDGFVVGHYRGAVSSPVFKFAAQPAFYAGCE